MTVPQSLIQDVFDHVARNNALGVGCKTHVDGLYAFSSRNTTACSASIYEPIMCLVLQGAKEAYVADRVIRYQAGDVLIVSHALPVDSAIIQASPEAPYTALVIQLDLTLARGLVDEIGGFDAVESDLHSVNAAQSEMALVDAVCRLYRLSDDPLEARALSPLIMKEIHFRLLRAKHGGMLRQLLLQESPASRISKTIAMIRRNFKSTIPVTELAAECGMSLSAFHEHFKSVTATTPLQYQKELRLLEARRLLLTGDTTVAVAAYDVGYESGRRESNPRH